MSYIENLFNLKNKTALITGACGQLGYHICKSFLSSGINTIGVDQSIKKNCVKGVKYYELNTTDIKKKSFIYEEIFNKYHRIDILVNNAGVSTFKSFEERSEEDLDFVYNVNLKGLIFDIQNYVKLFDKHKCKKGSIINIGSIFGQVSPDFRNYKSKNDRKNSEIYGATKAGIIQMTKYFSVYLANRNIRVNCVSPGGILNQENPQNLNFQKKYNFRTPMNRMAEYKEIIGSILYLSCDAASYTTGQNITIDGGYTAW